MLPGGLQTPLKKSALKIALYPSQMPIGQFRNLPPPGSAHNKSLLDQKRLVDLLYGFRTFGDRSGKGCNAYGATLEFIYDGDQDLIIHLVQTMGIHIQGL